MKPVAAAAALILAMTAQALPLSYLIELERAKIESATKLFRQECEDKFRVWSLFRQLVDLTTPAVGFVSTRHDRSVKTDPIMRWPWYCLSDGELPNVPDTPRIIVDVTSAGTKPKA